MKDWAKSGTGRRYTWFSRPASNCWTRTERLRCSVCGKERAIFRESPGTGKVVCLSCYKAEMIQIANKMRKSGAMTPEQYELLVKKCPWIKGEGGKGHGES